MATTGVEVEATVGVEVEERVESNPLEGEGENSTTPANPPSAAAATTTGSNGGNGSGDGSSSSSTGNGPLVELHTSDDTPWATEATRYQHHTTEDNTIQHNTT